MIEIHFDQRVIDRELARLGGSKHRLAHAVKMALQATAPQVRATVLTTLEKDVAVGSRFIKRAVKAVQNLGESSRFRVFSKNLFMDDYELTPMEQTARLGVPSREWPGFTYRLRKGGKEFHSFGTPTGGSGTGSVPFIAKTASGRLRVMYRRSADRAAPGRDVFLAYAPSIQYHAVAPDVEEAARETTMRIFHKELARAVDEMLAGRAS